MGADSPTQIPKAPNVALPTFERHGQPVRVGRLHCHFEAQRAAILPRIHPNHDQIVRCGLVPQSYLESGTGSQGIGSSNSGSDYPNPTQPLSHPAVSKCTCSST